MSHANDISDLADAAVAELKADLLILTQRLRRYLAELLKGAEVDAEGRLVSGSQNAELAAKLEADLGRIIVELGWHDAVHGVLTRFEDVAATTGAHLEDTLGASFSSVSQENIGAFVNGVAEELTTHLVDEAAQALREALLIAVNTHVPRDEEVAALARVAEITFRQAVTEVDTSLLAMNRESLVSTAEEAGFDLFRYDGPDDSLCRPFCAEHVGRVYTVGDLDAEDNGQGLTPTSRYLGGYLCRHSLSAVTVEEARAAAEDEGRDVIGGPEARKIVFGSLQGPNEAAFVAAYRGTVVVRSGRQTVVRRRAG